MSTLPVNIYYVPCHEPGCWVLFTTKPHLPFDSMCSEHGHALHIMDLMEGIVTQFEANQGWTKQRPD